MEGFGDNLKKKIITFQPIKIIIIKPPKKMKKG